MNFNVFPEISRDPSHDSSDDEDQEYVNTEKESNGVTKSGTTEDSERKVLNISNLIHTRALISLHVEQGFSQN